VAFDTEMVVGFGGQSAVAITAFEDALGQGDASRNFVQGHLINGFVFPFQDVLVACDFWAVRMSEGGSCDTDAEYEKEQSHA
jgi:hypothetical protein